MKCMIDSLGYEINKVNWGPPDCVRCDAKLSWGAGMSCH